MPDLSVPRSSKSWRVMCRVYYCFLTVLMLRAIWEVQYEISKSGAVEGVYEFIRDWVDDLEEQVFQSTAESARELVKQVDAMRKAWTKYFATKARFYPAYPGRTMYQDMMKNANNTMLDWEPAVIAQVGGVFLQTHVDGNADLQDMTIGKYISPDDMSVRNGANTLGYSAKLTATMLAVVVTTAANGYHEVAMETFNNYLALTAGQPIMQMEVQELVAAVATKINVLPVRAVTAQVGAPRRIVTRSVAPIRAPTTNAAASNDLAPTHRTAELEALFADVKLHDAVDKLEETDI